MSIQDDTTAGKRPIMIVTWICHPDPDLREDPSRQAASWLA